MKPKVSIISTIYNKAPWLDRLFKSILEQSFTDFEYIAVNNASTDESRSIMQKYAELDNRIKIIDIAKNIGPSNGFATGIDNIKGEYFTIIDADDYVDGDYIEKLVSAIEETQADASMCVNDMVWDDGTVKHKKWPEAKLNIIDSDMSKRLPCQLLDELSNKYFGFYMPEIGAVWNIMYKTALVKESKINFETPVWIWTDFVFNMRVIKQIKNLAYINTTVYHFYQAPNSVTRQAKFNARFIEHVCIAMQRIYEETQEILTDELITASNVFYAKRLNDIIGQYVKYLNNGVSVGMIKEAAQFVLQQNAIRQLCTNGNKSALTLKERLLVYSLNHGLIVPYSILRYFKEKLIVNLSRIKHSLIYVITKR